MSPSPNPIDHGIMSPFEAARVEQWCEIMHDAYELAAVGAGWETNPASRKPWADVPEANKVTMRAAVRAVIAHSDSELHRFPLRYAVGIDPVRLDEPVPFVIVDEPIGEVRAFPLEEGDTGEALLGGAEPTGTEGNRRGPSGYRCCKHCREDVVHDVPTDGHNGPCGTCDDPGAILRERLAEAERALAAEQATVARVKVALAYHPKACDKHPESDPVSCGWKRAVLDVQRALGGA